MEEFMFDTKGNPNIPIEQVQDPKTGETIHRVAIDPKLIAEIDKTIQTHQATMNQFVINSQAFFMSFQSQLELLYKIKVADEAIKKTLTDVTKKSKLDQKKGWMFNLQLKCFEFRSPPVVQGMSPSEIKSGQDGNKPTVVNKPGVSV